MRDKSRYYYRRAGRGGEKPTYYNRVGELKKDKGLTQEYIGRRLDMSLTAIGEIVRGKRNPRAKTKKILADFFNVSVEYLFPVDDDGRPMLRPQEEGKQTEGNIAA